MPQLRPVGRAYVALLADLLGAEHLKSLGLKKAARRAPEDKDGLNIEGLATGEHDALLIGFRNPLIGGKALIVPLANPQKVVVEGRKAEFGSPILLDLGGRGVRSIERIDSGYLRQRRRDAGQR